MYGSSRPSSLSSIDAIYQRRGNNQESAQSNKTSYENLIGSRNGNGGSDGAGFLWNRRAKEDPYSIGGNPRAGNFRAGGSDIYYSRRKDSLSGYCPYATTALNLVLVPLLLLTSIRQIFDFLGPIWLQIIINFFTIILIIVALFGIKQNRITYLLLFTVAALFNTFWNFVVIGIHLESIDLSLDLLSLYTGATSWWHTNGPGCLPHSVTSIQSSNSMFRSNMISGCRMDYHLIEATQAAVHSALSLISVMACCCAITSIRRNNNQLNRKQPATDHMYRMNNLTNNHTKINQDPYPTLGSLHSATSTSNTLRRTGNKMSSRSSQHSVSSIRSTRRRRLSSETNGNTLQAPRGSRSSAYRSSKYGSLSSRRSNRHRNGVSDVSSLTYGITGVKRPGTSQRTDISSLSGTEYLPSYQPPHTSSANLLSSYGELSSIASASAWN